MLSNDQNKQPDFMIEKIKERPVNKKKLLRRTVITASMAVIFGLIACFTFSVLEPVISNWLYPEEKPNYVEFPEEEDEMLPEDMIAESTEADIQQEIQEGIQQELENVLEQGGQIQEVLDKWKLDADNYSQLYTAMYTYKTEISKSIVTITGVTSDTDWFNNIYESTGQVSGVILADNGKELLILGDSAPLKNVDSITVTFFDNVQVPAVIKEEDSGTQLAIYAVDLADIPERTQERILIAGLGSSRSGAVVGTPVVAVGSPMGVTGSVGYGMVTATKPGWSVPDANYTLVLTDIYGSQNGNGIIFNMRYQVLGIITTGKNEDGMNNLVTGLGISELRRVITRMSNGSPETYLGIKGTDVTQKINKETQVPIGAYVTDVDMDSPAMLAGIQPGDVIIQLEDGAVRDFEDYTKELMEYAPGDTVEVTAMRRVQEGYKEVVFKVTLAEGK
ncbi:MAG: serine protease [Lachnospiraceae bacterium]|nr:serine protease [Lachnospiraceae bacterium]